jgi:hypothetical protein
MYSFDHTIERRTSTFAFDSILLRCEFLLKIHAAEPSHSLAAYCKIYHAGTQDSANIYIRKDACVINEREEGMDQTILLYSCHPRGGVCGVSVTSLEISNDISKLVTL